MSVTITEVPIATRAADQFTTCPACGQPTKTGPGNSEMALYILNGEIVGSCCMKCAASVATRLAGLEKKVEQLGGMLRTMVADIGAAIRARETNQ